MNGAKDWKMRAEGKERREMWEKLRMERKMRQMVWVERRRERESIYEYRRS